MQALELVAPHRVALRALPDPVPGPGEALVRPAYVGLCGTDLEMVAGTMPYLRTGLAAYPVILGHEWSGMVVTSPDAAFPAGTAVVVDPIIGCGRCPACATGPGSRCQSREEIGLRMGRQGALAELVAVPARNLVPVPATVSLRDAATAEPSVTVIAAVDRLEANDADADVLIIGAGTLGLVAAQVLVARHARVSVLMRRSTRAALVEEIGATPIVGQPDPGASWRGVIEASGSLDGFGASIALAAPGANVAIVGVYPATTELSPTDLVLRDLTITGILNGPGRYGRALEMMASGVLRPAMLIEEVHDLSSAEAAFAALGDPDRKRPKTMVRVRPP